MIYPFLNRAEALLSQGSYRRIPLKMELFSDSITPVMAIRRLKQASCHCFLLESAEQSRRWGRYSFLGYDPMLQFHPESILTPDGHTIIKNFLEVIK